MESKKIKILAVDDDRYSIGIIKAMINEAFPDAQVFAALSGTEGLELAASEEPDVILLDIVMPGIDGYEVCKQLKADQKLRDIPVVFVTGLKSDKEDRISALTSGAEAFLSKPIDYCELAVLIKAMVKIRVAHLKQQTETERLETLVKERTGQLEQELEDRKSLLDTLQESEEQFRQVFENANVGVGLVALDGRYLKVNGRMSEMFGFSQKEFEKMTVYDVSHPEEITRTRRIFNDAEKGIHTKKDHEKRFLDRQGNLLWAYVSCSIVRQVDGTPKYFVVHIQDITEPKQAEKKLLENEALFTTIFNLSPVPISLRDTDSGTYLRVNKAWSEMFGISQEEALGNNVFQLGIRAGSTFEDMDPSFRENDGVYSETVIVNTADNVEKELLLFVNLIDVDDKQMYLSTSIDITERNQALKLLKKSEERFKHVFESANVGKSITSLTGELNVNQAFCRMLGYTKEELVNKNWRDITPVDDIEAAQKVLDSMLRGENKEARFEKRYIHKNSTPVWTDLSVALHCDEQGRPVHFITTVVDITGQRLAKLRLGESEERFRKVFEEGPFGMAMADFKGGPFISANKAFCKMLGYTEEEMKTLTYRDITHPDHLHTDVAAVQDLAAGKIDKHNTEKCYLKKNGEIVWATRSLTRVGSADSPPFYALAMIDDITERKTAENALKESGELLRLSTELANVAAWEYDFRTDSMTRSKNHDSLYGLEFQEEWKFETFVASTYPDDREMSVSFIENSVAPGGPDEYKFDFRVVYPDQSIHWLNVIGEVVKRDEKGLGLLVRGFIIDITDRKLAEQESLEIRSRLRAALDSMTDAVFISNTEGRIIDRNEAFADFHRSREKEEGFESLSERCNAFEMMLAVGEAVPFEMWPVPRALRGEKITNAEYMLRRKDTGETWVGSYSFGPVRDKDGVVVGSVVVARDITDKKHAEEKIQEQLDELRRWYEVTLDREERVKELKREVNELLEKAGEPFRYASVIDNMPDDDGLFI